MKEYRVISEPTYGAGSRVDLEDRPFMAVGSVVHVDENRRPDEDGDVQAYRGAYSDAWSYVNARHLTPAETSDRAAHIREARAILGASADVDALIKLADYLQGGAA